MQMESHKLEIVLHSAKDLHDIKFFGTMNPYATLWIAGGDVVSEICKTNVAKKGGSYPIWDYPTEFKVDPMTNDYVLFCEIQHDGMLIDRMIGEVQVPFIELLAGDGSRKKASYPVKIPNSGEVKGEIIISHKFSQLVVVSGKKGGSITTTGNASRVGGSNTRKRSTMTGTKKKDGSMRISNNKVSRKRISGKKEHIGKVCRLKEKVKGKKKDGLMKKIVKNVGIKVGTKAVLFAGTIGAIFASEFLFDGNEHEHGNDDEVDYEDEDEDEDEDDDEYGNKGEDELEEEDGNVDEVKYGDEDEDEYENDDEDEYEEEDENEDENEDEIKYEDEEEDEYRSEDEDEFEEEDGNEYEDEDKDEDEDEDEDDYEEENEDEYDDKDENEYKDKDGNEDEEDDDYNDEYADEYY